MKMTKFRGLAAILCGAFMVCSAFAQEPPPPPPAGQESPPPPPALTPDQLDTLVAPIALYPDPLLSQILVASTYPLEVVEANQWMEQNQNLKGAALLDAAKQQNWDPSVQGLVAFPQVVAQLNRDVRWTTDLGDAFLAQQADVMAAVQRMREKAKSNGKLQSTAQQTVNVEDQNGQSAITIEPADPQVIYVPTYNPEWVWGPPVWGVYPPLFIPASESDSDSDRESISADSSADAAAGGRSDGDGDPTGSAVRSWSIIISCIAMVSPISTADRSGARLFGPTTPSIGSVSRTLTAR